MKVHQLINALSHLPSMAEVEGDLVKAVDGVVYSLEQLVDEISDAQGDGRHVQIANAKAAAPAPASSSSSALTTPVPGASGGTTPA